MKLTPTPRAPRLLAATCLAAALSLLLNRPLAAEELPKLGTDVASTSVSGLSSGAFMAVQIEVAHSKDIKGAGIVAGGPYACAESEASKEVPFWPSAVLQNAQQALEPVHANNLGNAGP